MENKPLVIALSVFGVGLLSAAMVGVVYVTKLDELQRRPAQVGMDWSGLAGFEGRTITTGGVDFTVVEVLLGEKVNPVIREPARAECQDEVVLKIQARNTAAGSVTITPGIFSLLGVTKSGVHQNFSQGFAPPTLASGAERTYSVGFKSLTTVYPCVLHIDGDTLREGAAPDLGTFRGIIDVCPGTL